MLGKGKTKKRISQLIQNFKNMDFEVLTEYTTIPMYNSSIDTDIIEKYNNNIDAIFVCGGDGTLHHVIKEIYAHGKNIPVGFIPLGTTNDFAKSLHVSRRKILDFDKNFDKYIPHNTDVGLINNNNVFVYIVAFGIFCKSSYKTDYKLKHKFRKIILYST